MSPTIAQMADAANVSQRLMAMVVKVHRRACPQLWEQMRAGKISTHLALQICSFDHSGQLLILAEMAGMTTRERTQFVQRVLTLARTRQEVA